MLGIYWRVAEELSASQAELCSMVSVSLLHSKSTEECLLCPCVQSTDYHYWKWNGQVDRILSTSASYFAAFGLKSRPKNGVTYRDISQNLSISPDRCSYSNSNYNTDVYFSKSCQSFVQGQSQHSKLKRCTNPRPPVGRYNKLFCYGG
jgi:hypothetical protein